MDTTEQAQKLLELMICPGFAVKDQKILFVNEGARRQFLSPGMEILPLLQTGREEFEAFKGGCLYVTMTIGGTTQGVTITRIEELFIFLADEETELRELSVLALAAQELRMPLSNVMLSADQLSEGPIKEEEQEKLARLNRGTSQLLRLIGNMSDALRYTKGVRLQTKNLTALLGEIFEKAQCLTAHTGVALSYQGPREDVFTLAEPEQLERAVYNLISNALKFTNPGGTIRGSLQKKGKYLQLTVEDSGSGIADSVLHNVFSRYLREPSLEDSRYGLGLGLVLVRAAARNHGGAVLIDQPGDGTRVTMTLAIRESSETLLKSPMLTVDYAGERDHGLIELSESLPAGLYGPQE